MRCWRLGVQTGDGTINSISDASDDTRTSAATIDERTTRSSDECSQWPAVERLPGQRPRPDSAGIGSPLAVAIDAPVCVINSDGGGYSPFFAFIPETVDPDQQSILIAGVGALRGWFVGARHYDWRWEYCRRLWRDRAEWRDAGRRCHV